MDDKTEERLSGWILKCTTCGTTWLLEVSFDIRDLRKLYHYCPKCRRNTFHEILKRSEQQ